MMQEEIEKARKEKKKYLLGLPLSILGAGINTLPNKSISNWESIPLVLFSIGSTIYIIIQTWKFSRSIGISKAMSVINALLSPIFFIFQLIFLLRIYSRKTGIGLTFFMRDKLPPIHESNSNFQL